MTPRPSIEIPAQEKLLQKYNQRVERLAQQDRLKKICTDAGFLKTVEVGQYFVTKHTDEFLQFAEPVTCREYTLPRDEKSTDTKGWIRGNTKIGPVLEVTTSYLQGKYGVEIRIESVDNYHSWVRISHGLNKLVTDLIDKEYDDNEQETSETKTEVFLRLQADQRLKQNREDLPLLARLPGLYLFLKEYGLILNQELNPIKRTQWQKDWTLFFGMDNFLEKMMERSNSGVWNMIFGTNLSTLNIGLTICGKAGWQEAEATRKGFNIVLIRQDKKFFTSELFKVIQDAIPLTLHDNVLIPNNFFEYIDHIGCAVSLHSITNSG